MYDNEAVEPYTHRGVDRVRSSIGVSQAACAEAEAGQRTARDRVAAVPLIATLLAANGYSPQEAAEIVRVAQQSWPGTLAD
jgi:hypothetical protein